MNNRFGLIILGLFLSGGLGAQVHWELKLVPGPHFSKTMGFGPWSYTVTPQMALWIEDSQGRWQRDLFVTPKALGRSWVAAPQEGRPEALPVWSHKQSLVDGVAGASPQKETTLKGTLAQGPSSGRVVLEVNRSYDFNARFPEGPGFVNGQPSVIYAWDLDSQGALKGSMAILGQGDPQGRDGDIRPGTQGLDTALELFSSMELRWKREPK